MHWIDIGRHYQLGGYLTPETIAPLGDDSAVSFPAIAS
jgi:hypothetical protein